MSTLEKEPYDGDNINPQSIDGNKNDIKPAHGKQMEAGQLEEIKTTIHAWAENTTFHGIKYVFDPQASALRRVVWFLLIIGMWCGLIISSISQYNRYFDFKTVTQDSVRSEQHLEFPSVSICNQCTMHNGTGKHENSQLLRMLGEVQSKEDYENLKEKLGPKLNENVTFLELFEGLGIPADILLYHCSFEQHILNCPEYWKPQVLNHIQCFTFNGNIGNERLRVKTVGRHNGGLMMTLFLDQDDCLNKDLVRSSGILLAVHEVGVEPDMSVSITLSPGFFHSIGVTIHEKTFLPPPVKAFGSSKCLDTQTSDFKNPLKFYPKYSLAACEHECIDEYINDSCGCYSTSDASKSERVNVCNVAMDKTCASSTYSRFLDSYHENVERCGCRERCQFTSYTTTVSSSLLQHEYLRSKPNTTTDEQLADKDFVRENFIILDVYIDSKVIRVSEQILDFTSDDLGASIGGFFGLAIGASILTFYEVFDMMITLAVRLFIRLWRSR